MTMLVALTVLAQATSATAPVAPTPAPPPPTMYGAPPTAQPPVMYGAPPTTPPPPVMYGAPPTTQSPPTMYGASAGATPVVPPPQEAQWLYPQKRRRFIWELGGGAFYERLFSVQAYGGEAFMAFGSSGEQNAWSVGLQYAHGQTFNGLDLVTWRLGPSFDWIFGQARVGLGPTLGSTSLDRATRQGELLIQVFIGADVHASYDLVPFGTKNALFARVDINVDTVVWGPTLSLGVRLEP